MITVAIIQSRMGSKRLPGKALKEIAGKPMLHHVIDRVKEAIPEVVVATTWLPEDNAIEEACRDYGVGLFRGDPINVLDRFIRVAYQREADKIVRITGDCPLIDPSVIKLVADALTEDKDYASNVFPRSYPKGLDCEAMWFDTLLRLNRLSLPEEMEHVTPAVRRLPELFRIANVENHAYLNLSVDTSEDLERVRLLSEIL